MYKVFIVDDEIDICRGLEILIDWEEIGFNVSGYACNGREALGKIREAACDVIITDIRMPEMDGLELIKALNGMNYKGRVLILSGYKDFEYARTALEYGVRDYILKPVNELKLIDALQAIKNDIEEELREKLVLRESQKVLKERALIELLKTGVENYIAYRQACELGVIIDGSRLYVCIVRIDHYETIMMNAEDSKAETSRFIIKNIVEEIVGKYSCGYVFDPGEDKIGILFSLKSDSEEGLKAIVQELFKCITDYSGQSITIAIGNGVYGYRKIRESYINANMALNCKSFVGGNWIAYFDEMSLTFYQMDNEIVKGMLEYINDNYYDNDISLKMFSKKYYMNTTYLGRLFKKATGTGFVDYINSIRIEKSMSLLGEKDLKIYEVCERVGYKDINYFNKVFKSIKGMTPSDYKLCYKKGKTGAQVFDQSKDLF